MKKDFLEINKENLHEIYIQKNVRLKDLPEYFGSNVSFIRKQLASFGIKKTQKLACKNSYETLLSERGKDYLSKRPLKTTTQKEIISQKVWGTRRNSIKEKYSKEGITYETLYQKYIIENLSLRELSIHFNKEKFQIRKVLQFFKIPPKEKNKVREAFYKGTEEFNNDSERKELHIKNTQTTIKKMYGHSWYKNSTSKQEKEIIEYIFQNFKNLEIKSGDYSIICNPSTGSALQIDVYLPELSLAIEFNGDYWHNRELYENDIKNKTCDSREMLKTRLCFEKNIYLIHMWYSDWVKDKESCLFSIKQEISSRIR